MKRITIPLLVFSLFFICGCASKPNLITNLPTATLTTKQLVGNDNIIPSPTLQKWSGSWTNSLGEKGNDTLEITLTVLVTSKVSGPVILVLLVNGLIAQISNLVVALLLVIIRLPVKLKRIF